MTKPSDRIKAQIDSLADQAQNYCYRRDEIVRDVTKIVDEAVRDAILMTANVMREDVRLAVMSDSAYCKVLEADNAKLRELLASAPGIDVELTVPERDYTNMSPLDCYEAGMLDAALRVREAIRAAIAAALKPRNPER